MRPVLLLSVFLLFACRFADSAATTAACQSVSAVYAAKNLDILQVQFQASSSHLAVCPARPGPTCCSRAMESALENRAKMDMYQTLYQQLVPRSTSLASLLSNFQSLVLQMLNDSYDGLDKNLKSIYGYSYIENKQPFVAFYEGLRAYMSGGPDTMAELARNLFDSISARVFVLVMANYDIDEAYLTCLRSRLNQLMPLGSMPERIGQEFVRAFVPARRFLAGLAALQDAVESAPAVRLTERCQKALLRTHYCAWCDGYADLRPCFGLCAASLADCMAPLNALAEPFDLLVDELVQLSEKIRGPNNVYQVLNQLGLRISGGIMDMQERKDSIQAQVSKLCGPPKLKAIGQPPLPPASGRRRRRRSSDMFGWSYRSSDDPPAVSDKQERLGQLARSAKQGLVATRGLFRWNNLAQRACQADTPPPTGRCWNGTEPASRYTAPPTAASPIEPPSAAVAQRAANLRAAHRLAAELPRSEIFAGFSEQRLEPGLSQLLSRRASSASGTGGASITDALPIGAVGASGGAGGRGGSGSGVAPPPPVPEPRPVPGGAAPPILRLSTLPPRTPPPPPRQPSEVWPPQPHRPDTAGSGDSTAPPAGPPPPPIVVTREPPPPPVPVTQRPPPIMVPTTTAPQPPPIDTGVGSGDEERPPSEAPPVPPSVVPVLPTTAYARPGGPDSGGVDGGGGGGAASGDTEPTGPPVGPPPPPRPLPSGQPPPDTGLGSGDGELPPQPPHERPSQPPPPPDTYWTPLPPQPPLPPQQPATPSVPGLPPGADLWLPKEPDDQGGAERGRGEGSIHGPMKMTSSKRSCSPGSLSCPACRPAAASAVALLLLACLQRLLLH